MSPVLAGTKVDFVEELRGFYVNSVGNKVGIEDMFFVADVEGDGNEYVYVEFGRGAQKRFCVSGLNNQGIMADFAKFISNMDAYPWLREEDRR